MSVAQVVINGERYEVVEWSLEDPDCDGEGTWRWVLYAVPSGDNADNGEG